MRQPEPPTRTSRRQAGLSPLYVYSSSSPDQGYTETMRQDQQSTTPAPMEPTLVDLLDLADSTDHLDLSASNDPSPSIPSNNPPPLQFS